MKSIIVFAIGVVLGFSTVSARAQLTTTSTSTTIHTTTTTSTTSTLPPKNELKCASTADPCVISGTPTVNINNTIFNVYPRSIQIDGDITLIPNPLAPKVTLIAKNITISERGSIKGEGGRITLDTTGIAGTPGSGGDIILLHGSTASARAQIDVSGPLGGGEIVALAGGKIVVAGTLQAIGQDGSDGGDITLQANNGPIQILPSANDDISVAGAQAGFGGSISMTTLQGDISVNRRLDLTGGDGSADIEANNGTLTCLGDIDTGGDAQDDDGGDIFLFSNGNMSLQGQILAVSGQDGQGGEIDIESDLGNVIAAQQIDAHGTGLDGFGSILASIVADTGNVTVASVDVSGGSQGGAGEIDLTSGIPAGIISINGDQLADGGGGTFAALGGVINVNAQIVSDGPFGGGDISFNGCNVTVNALVSNQSVPPGQGRNTFIAGARLTIGGLAHLVAGEGNGFYFGDPTKPPIVNAGAIVTPAVQEKCPATTGAPKFGSCLDPTAVQFCGLVPPTTTSTIPLPTTTSTSLPAPTTTSTSTSSTSTTIIIPTTTTTSTSSTSSSSSTSTSTSTRPPTTTSTTSSTTTSTVPPCNCSTPDPCLDVQCTSGVCSYPPKTGNAAVTCRLDGIDSELHSGIIATPSFEKSLEAKIQGARLAFQKATAASAPNKAKKLRKKAKSQLGKFVKVVGKGRGTKIEVGLADRVTSLAQGAMGGIDAIIAGGSQ